MHSAPRVERAHNYGGAVAELVAGRVEKSEGLTSSQGANERFEPLLLTHFRAKRRPLAGEVLSTFPTCAFAPMTMRSSSVIGQSASRTPSRKSTLPSRATYEQVKKCQLIRNSRQLSGMNKRTPSPRRVPRVVQQHIR